MAETFILIQSLGGGGAERIAVDLASGLNGQTLLISISGSAPVYKITSEYQFLSKSKVGTLEVTISFPVLFLKYLKLLQSEHPMVSISLLDFANLLNIISSVFVKTRPIISVHGMPSNPLPLSNCLLRRTVFWLAKWTNTHVIAVSNSVKKELVEICKIPKDNISVIYNPIDIETIQKLSKESVSDVIILPSTPTIITVGRLDWFKGQWHLLRVFAELRKSVPCHLIICGEGPEGEYLKKLANDLGITDDVSFLGWRDNPYKYMARADVFVQTSLSEALPNVLIEAMACGCPVIAANCSGGIGEILGENGEYGILSEKLSDIRYSAIDELNIAETDLLHKIELVLCDENVRNRLSEVGKERARYFSTEKQLCEYETLINKIISETTPNHRTV